MSAVDVDRRNARREDCESDPFETYHAACFIRERPVCDGRIVDRWRGLWGINQFVNRDCHESITCTLSLSFTWFPLLPSERNGACNLQLCPLAFVVGDGSLLSSLEAQRKREKRIKFTLLR